MLLIGSFYLLGLAPFLDFLGPHRAILIWQWSFYGVSMCTFHLTEFFTTALFNPSVTSADSFLVNHSPAYTAAALASWLEFGIRFCVWPRWNSTIVTLVGVMVVLISQTIRSLAMITCGESFNHLIQTSKKDNHVLITNGIYQYFRHPSYVGFYYWSVGTQLLLGNYLSALVFAIASCLFFRKRIPYEEESLLQHFPAEYPAYMQQTWIGIPFVRSCILPQQEELLHEEDSDKKSR